MPPTQLHFERDYDLPVVIVWDALIDVDLVEGWLAAARIEPKLGGQYWLDWQTDVRVASTTGRISGFAPPSASTPRGEQWARLDIQTDNMGTLAFALDTLPGGTRDFGTRLTLTIDVDTEPRLLARTRAYWLSNFDQLEELLRGHPVDWTTWQQDRGDAFAAYLENRA